MDTVPLGRSGLVSSVLGLGGGSSGRFGLVKGGTRSDALRLIGTALDQGITFFDGAGICGGVDELLAEGLAARRQGVVLSTKVHLGGDPSPFTTMRLANQASAWIARRSGLVCSGATLRKRVERTLTMLRTDRIDILHLHAVFPRQYPPTAERLLPELTKMKEEGKIRAIGVTEAFLADPGHAMLRTALGDACVDVIMVGFNVRNSSAAETVFPAAMKAGVGVIGMFAMRDLLSSAAARPPSAGGNVGGLNQILDEAGITSLSELAYRYCRHQAGMDVVMTGTGDPAHLQQNIAAAMAPPLPAAVLDRLRAMSIVPVRLAQADDTSTR